MMPEDDDVVFPCEMDGFALALVAALLNLGVHSCSWVPRVRINQFQIRVLLMHLINERRQSSSQISQTSLPAVRITGLSFQYGANNCIFNVFDYSLCGVSVVCEKQWIQFRWIFGCILGANDLHSLEVGRQITAAVTSPRLHQMEFH